MTGKAMDTNKLLAKALTDDIAKAYEDSGYYIRQMNYYKEKGL